VSISRNASLQFVDWCVRLIVCLEKLQCIFDGLEYPCTPEIKKKKNTRGSEYERSKSTSEIESSS